MPVPFRMKIIKASFKTPVLARVHAVVCIQLTQWLPPFAEALGMSLPYSASNPAVSEDKKNELKQAALVIKNLLEKDIKPGDIMTFKAFENAIRLVIVLGGSTNAVMHLIAMAKTIGVKVTLDDLFAWEIQHLC